MRRPALLTLTLLLALPGAAIAQRPNADDVFIDPGSPTSKEYAIPTEEARRDASGAPGGGGSGQPPLFGAGVERGSERDQPAGSATRTRETSPRLDERGADVAAARAVSGRSTGGLSTAATAGLISLLVLLLGGGIAYMLKRRQGWTLPSLRRAS